MRIVKIENLAFIERIDSKSSEIRTVRAENDIPKLILNQQVALEQKNTRTRSNSLEDTSLRNFGIAGKVLNVFWSIVVVRIVSSSHSKEN